VNLGKEREKKGIVDYDEYLDLVRVSEPSGLRPRDFFALKKLLLPIYLSCDE